MLFAFVLSPAARGQSASFEIAQHGHPVGTASYRFIATPQGYTSTSLVRVAMQGLDYALSKDESLTPANHLRHVSLSATVNGSAVTAVAKPDAGKLLLNISASGRSTTTDVARRTRARCFSPTSMPARWRHCSRWQLSRTTAICGPSFPRRRAQWCRCELATYADMQGTLNGKTIAVHHLVATIAGAETELFSGPENQLLQAELPQEGFALVRKGFVLQPPARAPAPPPHPQTAPAPTPSPG